MYFGAPSPKKSAFSISMSPTFDDFESKSVGLLVFPIATFSELPRYQIQPDSDSAGFSNKNQVYLILFA